MPTPRPAGADLRPGRPGVEIEDALSVAGGVAVSYVFLHIRPDLAAPQDTVAQSLRFSARLAEVVVFGTALAGLAAFYGLESLALSSRPRRRRAGADDGVEAGMFWIHIGSFALYNLLIGHLPVHQGGSGAASTVVSFLAMTTHFVANDVGLWRAHRDRSEHVGRWIVASGGLSGWAAGTLVKLPEIGIALIFALLAGGVVLNVLKAELPAERQSRFLPFVSGALASAAVLAMASLI